jgi:lipoteichoic acid synthase
MHISSPSPKKFRAQPVGLALFLLLALVGFRAYSVGASIGAYAGCVSCLVLNTLLHDLRLFLGLLLIVYWLVYLPSQVLRWLCAVMLIAFASAFVADLVVYQLLNFRLLASEIAKFYGEGDSILSVLRDILKNPLSAILLGVGICWTFALPWFAFRQHHYPRSRVLAGMMASAWIATLLVPTTPYLFKESYYNVLEVNWPSPLDQDYSEARKAELLASTPLRPTEHCTMGLAQRVNVTVLVVESLSAYQSKLLGGPWNVLPKLDQTMQQESYDPNFIANGFSTDGGLIAAFSGRVPIATQQRFRSVVAYQGFTPAVNNFYPTLKRLGYKRSFLMTADREFLGAQSWLRELGFDEVEGSEASFYQSFPRGQFGAAEDSALYQRTLQWMRAQSNKEPYFLGLLTTQSHPPFPHPKTGKTGEAELMPYIDASMDAFIAQLRAERYFEQGLLIVMGDHRAMTPLKSGEAQFGAQVFSRVPLLVIGQGSMRGAIRGFQQTDVIPSVLALIDDQPQCLTPTQGRFLGTSVRAPEVRVYANGVTRDVVYMEHAAGVSRLFLNGDQSTIDGPKTPVIEAIAQDIHHDRVRRGPVKNNFADLILGRNQP